MLRIFYELFSVNLHVEGEDRYGHENQPEETVSVPGGDGEGVLLPVQVRALTLARLLTWDHAQVRLTDDLKCRLCHDIFKSGNRYI